MDGQLFNKDAALCRSMSTYYSLLETLSLAKRTVAAVTVSGRRCCRLYIRLPARIVGDWADSEFLLTLPAGQLLVDALSAGQRGLPTAWRAHFQNACKIYRFWIFFNKDCALNGVNLLVLFQSRARAPFLRQLCIANMLPHRGWSSFFMYKICSYWRVAKVSKIRGKIEDATTLMSSTVLFELFTNFT